MVLVQVVARPEDETLGQRLDEGEPVAAVAGFAPLKKSSKFSSPTFHDLRHAVLRVSPCHLALLKLEPLPTAPLGSNEANNRSK